MSPRQPIFWFVVASTFVSTPYARGDLLRSTDPHLAIVCDLLGDPVEELREALRANPEAGNSKEVLESRRKDLERRADAVNRLTDLGRALLLQEWHEADQRDMDEGRVEHEVLDKLAARFRTGVQEVLRKGDAPRRAAAATFLGETVANARAGGIRSVPVGRTFAELAPDLAQATADADPSVREAAAVALSKIDGRAKPDAKLVAVEVAVPAYRKMLDSKDVASRRAAAAALGEVVRTLHGSVLRGHHRAPVLEISQLGEAVVPSLAGGLRDADSEVRRHSVEALREVAEGLPELVYMTNRLPAALVNERQLLDELTQLAPLAKPLRDRVPDVAAALNDEAAAVPACAALEAVANARRHLVGRAAAIARSSREKEEKGKGDPSFADMLGEELRKAVPALTKLLASKDVRTRLAALYALETFGDAAAPAAHALVKALADADPFVRWGAARALGRMASPEGTQAAEKAGAFAELARRLGDDSEDVRVTAAAALERYGPDARAAGSEAARFVNEGDAEARMLAIRVLAAVKADAKAAVPALTNALGAKEAPVRRAAVKALARYGGDAAPASDKLRELMLRDPVIEVRQAAAAAFLDGVPPPKPGDREGPREGPAEQCEPIAPGSGLASPLDARELARAMFEASRADPKQIARHKLETARHGFEAMLASFQVGGRASQLDPGLEWQRRVLVAELALCESPAEQAAAYQWFWQVAWEREHVTQFQFEAGRKPLADLMHSRYERLTAEMDWARARARAGKEKPRPQAEMVPTFRPPEASFDDLRRSLTERAKAQYEASRADLGELARQRVAAAHAAYRHRLEWFLAGRERLAGVLESSAHVAEAELAIPGGMVDLAAIRERAWEMSWIAHEISRAQFEAGRWAGTNLAEWYGDPPASRYALLQAEIALVRAGQAGRPGRVGSLLNVPAVGEVFDAKALARARAEAGRAGLDDLLRQRLETARTTYRAREEQLLAGKGLTQDTLLEWSQRLLESELALDNGPAGREAAHARHWKRAWQVEAVTRDGYEKGRKAIADLMAARYVRLDAELLWAQAR